MTTTVTGRAKIVADSKAPGTKAGFVRRVVTINAAMESVILAVLAGDAVNTGIATAGAAETGAMSVGMGIATLATTIAGVDTEMTEMTVMIVMTGTMGDVTTVGMVGATEATTGVPARPNPNVVRARAAR
ncbi:hypothetical protein [Mobiluncus mulieris]|uniref:hypothetical protein n=1 Tax=Mobiluncus mulieris TaxID=2052 RepID=UPI0020168862|nr:hypothetical protein [Mobiluncus mulieris]